MNKITFFVFFIVLLPSLLKAQEMDVGDTASAEKQPLMQRVEDFALKDNIVSRLLRSVIVFEPKESPEDTTRASEVKYKTYDGKVIKEVRITVLDPFGYSVYEPTCKPVNWLQKNGNLLHYPTRDWVVRNKLLFHEGDKVDAFTISETERLLRANSSILDAKVNVVPTTSSEDSVIVDVMVQDVFSLGGTVSGNPLDKNGDVSVTELNFLGLGHRLENKLWYNDNYYAKWKYSGSYFVPEIANTYISAEVHYFTENLDKRYGVAFNRPFFSPSIHWAGGLSLESIHNHFSVPINDSASYTGKHKIQEQDVWLGYAFNPNDRKSLYKRKLQMFVSGRVKNTNYLDRYIYNKELDHTFQNTTLTLGSIGYSFREYYKDRYIFGFGRTEDIPLGYLLSYTAGVEKKMYSSRFYSGMKASMGHNHSALGYSFLSFEAGGFLNKSKVEQGVLAAQLLYFTSVIPMGKWQMRQFFWNRFSLGYNRLPGEQLNIDRENGLRGFSSSMLRGTQKLTTNYELNLFTPYSPLGFKIVGVLFADFALLGSHEDPLFHSKLYQGYGIGLRVKNEHLIFNTFQLSFHYYPDAELFDSREYKFLHTEKPYYPLQDFQFSQPYTVGF